MDERASTTLYYTILTRLYFSRFFYYVKYSYLTASFFYCRWHLVIEIILMHQTKVGVHCWYLVLLMALESLEFAIDLDFAFFLAELI